MDFDKLELGGPAPAQPPKHTGVPQEEPTDAAACFAKARALRMNGRMSEAANNYQRVLGLQEHHFKAWMEGVDCLIRVGRKPEALAWAQRAVDGHRQTRILYASLALAQAHMGDMEQALKLSDISLDIERPDYPVTVRGELLLLAHPGSRSHRDLALECFEEASRLAPDPWDTLFVAGCALFDARWPAYAAGYFAESAHASPLAAASWLGLADSFHALRLHEQAAFYCARALEIDPFLQAGYQKQSGIKRAVFGLMRVFKQEDLEARWMAAFKKALDDVGLGSFRER